LIWQCQSEHKSELVQSTHRPEEADSLKPLQTSDIHFTQQTGLFFSTFSKVSLYETEGFDLCNKKHGKSTLKIIPEAGNTELGRPVLKKYYLKHSN